MNPTLAGFQNFIVTVMGIDSSKLSLSNPVVAMVYNLAVNTVNLALVAIPNADTSQPTIYATAVYNLAGDLLINLAQDSPPSFAPPLSYFNQLRTNFGCNSFVGGVLNSTSDEGTSEGMTVPDFAAGLTVGQLNNLKTPYGRVYLAIAGSYGSLWGLS